MSKTPQEKKPRSKRRSKKRTSRKSKRHSGVLTRKNTEAFGSFADMEPEEANFLVYPYIVLGAVTMLDGDPKQGKSSFTAALAAHVTTGRDLPFGKLERTGGVLFLSIEDDPAKIILPRLNANGADQTKCRYLREYLALDEAGLNALDEELTRNPAVLVIIDPLFTYMDAAANSNSATDMARYMTQLSEIAAAHDCAILAVRHLNKSDSQDILMRGMGSKAIVGTARSGLLLAKHPSDAKLRAVAHAASNWGPEGQTILFEMEEREDRMPPRLAWKGVDNKMDGSSLLAEPTAADAGRKPKEGIQAEMFIRTTLLDGPVNGKEIGRRAKRLGITDITLRRAREELGVKFTNEGRARLWKLPKDD
ncbi:AAA family ATPase [Ruegeria sp. HKCCD7318]|uniref:AAA family ATPase n=1 Tax=Ruegeria sp. HKCCD7318 TaxID=2683014 RepID=UPI001491B407|nr:AAA family ATPase [Ruegeria sp. HKCCD7318]NOE32178.1 AAA family ATPase [Ruegeria sp. HKCCD7318]